MTPRIESHRIVSHRIESHRTVSRRSAARRFAAGRIATRRIVSHHVGWILESWGASFRGALEYRTSFATQALFMLANNFLFLAFWAIFFHRVPQVGGWTLKDVALCYGVGATAFGLAAVLCGGVFDLSSSIARGGIDSWLLRPRSVLAQAFSSRMRLSGFGDLVTGPLLLVLAGHATPRRTLVFVAGSVVGAIVFLSFLVACHALAFWLGRAEDLSQLGVNAILTFALYPPSLFQGTARVLLFTVVPAGLMSWLPAELVLRWDAAGALKLLAGAGCAVGAAFVIWTRGLARYESGNLVQSTGD